jgi:hypothetical protein
MDRLALREPVERGLKVTPMLQLLPAATLVPHGLACVDAKSPGLVPVKVTWFTVRADVPVLVSTMVCGWLTLFTNLEPKSKFIGTSSTVPFDTVMVAAAALVLSETDVAVRVTGPFAGTEAGAVKVTGAPLAVLDGVIVPQTGEQEVEFCVSIQFTPALAGSLATVAVNVCCTFTGMSALGAESETVIAGTVIMAVPVTRVLKTEVAVRVTGKSLGGGVGGAV